MAQPKLHSTALFEQQSAELLELSEYSRDRQYQFPGWSGWISHPNFLFTLLIEIAGHVPAAVWLRAIARAKEKMESGVRHVIHQMVEEGAPRWTNYGAYEVDRSAQRAIGVMAQESLEAIAA